MINKYLLDGRKEEREGMREGRRKEERKEEGIVIAHRQSANVRYNKVHASKPHFWAGIDAGSFVAQKQMGRLELHPLHTPSSPEWGQQVAGCCVVVSRSQEAAFTSAHYSWFPAPGKVIFSIG